MPSIQDIMTTSPRTTNSAASIGSIASAMAAGDFGAMAVVDSNQHPMGIITDRDIVVRGLARGYGPDTRVGELMSIGCTTIRHDASQEEARQLMQRDRIRRLVAVDDRGGVCGMVATADLACHVDNSQAGSVLKQVSST